MQTFFILVDAERFDRHARTPTRRKYVFLQAFIAQPTVEALGKVLLYGLARLNESQFDVVAVRPLVKVFVDQFVRPVDIYPARISRTTDTNQNGRLLHIGN